MNGPVRVAVDASRCQAYGLCVAVHPDVFDVPAGSPTAVVLRDVVGAGDLDDVEQAVRACPAQALSLHPAGER
ncbi:ferredoxin [Dactylosporangium sp. CA-092794]|uniref:ferredoxin n=1 Tax=Dactylosporangium sp. CA-092794 TaxID=3239929 RepID=UPI003D8BD758